MSALVDEQVSCQHGSKMATRVDGVYYACDPLDGAHTKKLQLVSIDRERDAFRAE